MQNSSLTSLGLIEVTKRQLVDLLNITDTLLCMRTPYDDTQRAIKQIRIRFEEHQGRLFSLNEDTEQKIIENLCLTINMHIYQYLPVLGFLLRSTNIRNAFEARGPLLELARKCLGEQSVGMIISSDWSFSPYAQSPSDKDFVMIGMPAHASSNSFLYSLAGHELGHSLWARENYKKDFENELSVNAQELLVLPEFTEFARQSTGFIDVESLNPEDIFTLSSLTKLVDWSLKQTQEVFCDFVGLWLFGEAYLFAFTYYLSAFQHVGQRSVEYPTIQQRANYILQASKEYFPEFTDEITGQFTSLCCSGEEPSKTIEANLADTLTESVVNKALTEVKTLLTERGVGRPQGDRIERCVECFSDLMPPESDVSFAEILVAGWKTLLEKDKLVDFSDKKESILNEVVLKSFELLEISYLLKPELLTAGDNNGNS